MFAPFNLKWRFLAKLEPCITRVYWNALQLIGQRIRRVLSNMVLALAGIKPWKRAPFFP